MEKQLRTHYQKVVNGKRRWMEDGGFIGNVTERTDGFMVGTKTERDRRGNETTNILFIVSPNLYAMLEKAGHITEPTNPWE